tara:strand:+ start:1180 stop:1977 length:798 start_codon:yes stop_codon:yes gene_type:complete
MSDQTNKVKASVIVVNYNNSKYIERCINSLKKQSYKNIEIIFVDDHSTDNSISIIKKFKKIKIFKTSTKTNFGSLNQINACKKGISKSNGKIIFFLDSDDFFKKNKVEIVIKYFNEKKFKICFDKPIFYFNKKKQKKININTRNKYFIPWPKFGPQSCIAAEKKYLKNVLFKISTKNFKNIWFDFRLINQAYLDFGKIFVVPNYLTFYQQNNNTASSNFKKFSKNWWQRRNEAHSFLKYLYKINKKKFSPSLDTFATYVINSLIK